MYKNSCSSACKHALSPWRTIIWPFDGDKHGSWLNVWNIVDWGGYGHGYDFGLEDADKVHKHDKPWDLAS